MPEVNGKVEIMNGLAIFELESAWIQRLGKKSMHIFHDENHMIEPESSRGGSACLNATIGTNFIFQAIEIKEEKIHVRA